MFLSKYIINTNVNVVKGDQRNIYIVELNITSPTTGESQQRKYQFR